MLSAACISWSKSSFRFFCNILWKISKNFLVNPMYYFFSPTTPPPNHHEVGTIWAHIKDKGIELHIKFAQLIHHFANKGLSSQSFGFSSSDVWMWELDQKEGWAPKNRYFELWYWRRRLRVPQTARRSNRSILQEINSEYSLEGLMLKQKLQYFGHLMQRADSLEKTVMTVKTEGRKRRGWQRMSWLDGIIHHPRWLDGHEFEQILGDNEGQGSLECCSPSGRKQTWLSNWTNIKLCVYLTPESVLATHKSEFSSSWVNLLLFYRGILDHNLLG